ncbi:S1 family peptidase [Bradyrhizobium sp. 131]|uniref:S1 family peptidase n=1 Tax=Bradyrhizobium sp. 131 TaxID=2782609 RepID=UPI001FFF7C34|nr:S1 family peptidase [Bradyrhizobium sp. 131]UPK17583.1 S1 family peptidase [Bradyrhizobium sp. 131]
MVTVKVSVAILANLVVLPATEAEELSARIGQRMPAFRNAAASAEAFSSIVGGTITKDFPTVGALLQLGPNNQVLNACTGTLIGCRWFLTAGHCIANQNAEAWKVFLQPTGFHDVKSPGHLAPEFKPCAKDQVGACPQGDIALLELTQPVQGIRTAPITRANQVPPGDTGTIVGFGTTSSSRADFGIKRRGAVTAGICNGNVPGADDLGWLCWKYLSGRNATTCFADSGGPYIASNGAVAAVSTGDISKDACSNGALVFDTRLIKYLKWLDQAAPDARSGTCGDGPQAGDSTAPTTQLVNENYRPDGAPYAHAFNVDAGASSLHVSVGGSGPLFYNVQATSLSLINPVNKDHPDQRCKAEVIGNLAHCDVEAPEPGEWQLVVSFKAKNPAAEMPFVYQVVASEYMAKK